MHKEIEQSFAVHYSYPVIFTRGALHRDNLTLAHTFLRAGPQPHRALLVVDSGVARATPDLLEMASEYARTHAGQLHLVSPSVVIAGGEACKNDESQLDVIHKLVNEHGLCRQSFVLVIGGGAVLDAVGYAVATAHRGLRLVRMPTTVLAQNDAGVGVKNGINALGRKNFLGTFAPPFAVINDLDFLQTLQPRDVRAGMAEAVKVAAIKDAAFLDWLHTQRRSLAAFDSASIEHLVVRCAELHIEHIRCGDPFELGSARPLDFGHWSAHKLEELTAGELRHGEAVAIGIALDSLYAARSGLLSDREQGRIHETLADIGLELFHPALLEMDVKAALQEFQEHIGGELSLALPAGPGRLVEIHGIDLEMMKRCIRLLAEMHSSPGATPQGPTHVESLLPHDGTAST